MPTETDAEEKTLVNFRLGVDQKQDWVDYLEQTNDYPTISELIRKSVEAEISGDHDNGSPESPALSSDVQKLSEDVSRIKKDVRWLKNQAQDSVDISDVAQEVFDEMVVLPERQGNRPEDVDADEEQLAAISVITPDDDDDEPHPQTLAAIANRVGITEDECADAIEHLQDQFLPVVEVDLQDVSFAPEMVGQETHYFKEKAR